MGNHYFGNECISVTTKISQKIIKHKLFQMVSLVGQHPLSQTLPVKLPPGSGET